MKNGTAANMVSMNGIAFSDGKQHSRPLAVLPAIPWPVLNYLLADKGEAAISGFCLPWTDNCFRPVSTVDHRAPGGYLIKPASGDINGDPTRENP